MSDLTELHNEYAKYIYLHIDPAGLQDGAAIAIQVKMDDEGIAVDAWSR